MSTPNYDRPAFSPCDPKPIRGARVLEKEEADAAYLALEREVKAVVRKRDGRCRFAPIAHVCRFQLECVHVIDASRGGPMAPWNLILGCGWIHRRGTPSVHGKQIKVTHETEPGAAVPLFAFWQQGDDGEYYLVAREIAPFAYERD